MPRIRISRIVGSHEQRDRAFVLAVLRHHDEQVVGFPLCVLGARSEALIHLAEAGKPDSVKRYAGMGSGDPLQVETQLPVGFGELSLPAARERRRAGAENVDARDLVGPVKRIHQRHVGPCPCVEEAGTPQRLRERCSSGHVVVLVPLGVAVWRPAGDADHIGELNSAVQTLPMLECGANACIIGVVHEYEMTFAAVSGTVRDTDRAHIIAPSSVPGRDSRSAASPISCSAGRIWRSQSPVHSGHRVSSSG